MIGLIIDVVLILVGFAGGWYCCRKFGTVADKVAQDTGLQK